MSESVIDRLLDRELVDVIERLSVDFVEIPVAAVIDAVHAVASKHRDCPLDQVREVAVKVEHAAREALTPSASASA